MNRPRALLVAATLLAWAGGARAQAAGDAVRAEFRAALDGAAQVVRRAPDSAALRGYVLYPYVEAARLRNALSRVPADRREVMAEAAVEGFLQRAGDEPVARELRRDWLAYLGERRVWPKFLAQAPPAPADLALRCHALHARLGPPAADGLRDEALALWLAHRERPAACDPVFQWLEEPGRLAAPEIESRALFAARNRLRLPAGLPGLAPERQALVQWWERLRGQPERELKAFVAAPGAQGADTERAEALVEAFDRVARRDSKLAAGLFEGLAKQKVFSEAQRHELRLSYALGLAYDLDPAALDQFRKLPEEALDALAREWRVRAALLHRDWRHALAWLEAMPPVQRDEPRWRYFRARLLEKR